MGYKLTWVYIGQTKVRPSGWGWWQPWANTLAYYPLTSTTTVNDMSGNNKNMTNNWSVTFGNVLWVDCATFSWSNYLNKGESLFTWSATFTVNLWYKKTWNYDNHTNLFTIGTSNGKNNFLIWGYPSWDKINHLMLWWWDNDRDTLYIVPSNTWINIIVTHSWWAVNVYINGNLQYTWTVDYNIQSWYTWVWCSPTNSTPMIWNMSNLIIESSQRTSQEASDYYNLTKWNYWIS